MENFIYHLPTQIAFGKGQIQRLPEFLAEYGSKILLLYGGGSIKKNGIYDEAIRLMKENNMTYYELSGVEPNPQISTVKKGIEICRENNIDVLLPIGGGSTIDCAKTYTVPPYHTAAGVADIMSHIFEYYFNGDTVLDIQRAMMNSILKTCVRYGLIAVKHLDDEKARANLMWAASWAINGFIAGGTVSILRGDGMNLFDIMGPVMVGPSSSHTAGAVKIGRVARKLMAQPILHADILLYGSFLATGKGHGTPYAIVAGLLGMMPDDERIPQSFEIAKEKGMLFTFGKADLKDAHPNSVVLRLQGVDGKKLEIEGQSGFVCSRRDWRSNCNECQYFRCGRRMSGRNRNSQCHGSGSTDIFRGRRQYKDYSCCGAGIKEYAGVNL